MLPTRLTPSPPAPDRKRVRSSQIVVFNGVAKFTCTPNRPYQPGIDIAEQTRQLLARADERLKAINAGRSSIISAFIAISDASHFDGMNEIWDDWIDPEHAPSRMCIVTNFAKDHIKVEMVFTAAVQP